MSAGGNRWNDDDFNDCNCKTQGTWLMPWVTTCLASLSTTDDFPGT